MATGNDLLSEVTAIFATNWESREGQQVPEPTSVALGNDAVKLNATVLYADLAESTNLVDSETASFAAEIYKSYLVCATRIIKDEGGVITAFDGDRVMGVFIGQTKNTSAVKSALKINYAVTQLINPALNKQYPNKQYEVRQAVGVDTSELFVARTGIRGSNDLVWVGRAANYAAKLCSLRSESYASWITKDVFDAMLEEVKTSSDGRPMWEQRIWTARNNMTIYRSLWRWRID
ncbi:adenylate/guanylate cyclase domain-containing protein [Comamonas sp. JC664]|uniref:adenylate/guanylate cyclase domain-containing protein n=1 Tax=Comamonas sp. JC664 TaxID=2801917 RepID=UPI00174BF93C|nr:adenylate/guanylate cyclase domain-containing protein [Comamonas sp. JC664]MBL0692200.1 adenylate/guanylate cyclase domain-containing protein [Comamonas sp. JC664]GHH04726.1 guanylate cyclase [Comamonas sp. KCTC 72670]